MSAIFCPNGNFFWQGLTATCTHCKTYAYKLHISDILSHNQVHALQAGLLAIIESAGQAYAPTLLANYWPEVHR